MQNSIIKEFENNPDVVAAVYEQGGQNGETRQWVETLWSNFHLRGGIIWDASGTNGKNTYAQPDTGLPFGRSYVIDQQGNIAAATFGYDPSSVIQTIYSLLRKQNVGACHDLADGTLVRIPAQAITAGSDQIGGAFYVEDTGRVGGIRVNWSGGPTIPAGIAADVTGRLATAASGERELVATSVTRGGALALDPLGLTNSALGGSTPGDWSLGIPDASGLYNVGLLVRCWGTVTEMGDGCFWIDDGSRIDADTGHVGVRVLTGSIQLPPELDEGSMVAAAGISSMARISGQIVRCLLARSAADITVVKP